MTTAWLALLLAAEPSGLRLEDPTFRQFEDGPPYQQSYRPGEQVFFDLRIAGYGRSDGENPELKLKWSFRALDASSRLLEPEVAGKFETGLAAQDTDYRPRARFSVTAPVFALDGIYRVQVRLTDVVADKTVEGTFPFQIRGKRLTAETPLGAGNFRFLRKEDDPAALAVPVYRPGSEVWMRFDLQGYELGKGNRFRVGYAVTITGPDGKVFLKQDSAATEEGEPFYPQAYVPATFVVKLPVKALTGAYRLELKVKDLLANREQAIFQTFQVE